MKLSVVILGLLALVVVSYAVETSPLIVALTPSEAQELQATGQVRPKRSLLLGALGVGALGAGALGAAALGAGAIGAGALGAGVIGAKAGFIGGALASNAFHGRSYGGGGWGHGGYYGGGGWGHEGYYSSYPTTYIVEDEWY